MKDPDILAAVGPVAEAFEKLGILYCIGGSVASSAYGKPRATLDVDVVSDLAQRHVGSLVKMLESSCYIDEIAISKAIRRRSSFNLIHLETMIKVDVFIVRDRPYPQQAMRRRRKDTLAEDQHAVEYYLASCEDIILTKLDWYRMDGKVSERQWSDVVGVLKVQEKSLDRVYLRHWASELNLTGLLKQAFMDAEIKSEVEDP